MLTYGTVFIFAVAIGFAATLFMRWLARRTGVVDAPDGFRKMQGTAIPLLGGVGIFAAFCASLALSRLLVRTQVPNPSVEAPDVWLILAGGAVVLALGMVDDIWGLRSRWKLLGMFIVSVAMYACGFQIAAISNPFGPAIHLGWLAPVVTIFWFLGCMNAINLIDGLDGLATGVTVFAASTVLLVGLMLSNGTAAILATALAGACLGFLVFNFYPASIYLGDCGSLLLGFLLACIGLKGAQKSQMVVALLIPMVALGLPIMDTSLAIVRRWLKSLPFSASDHQHIHHKLLEMGLSHRSAVLVMYAACFVLGALALLTTAATSLHSAAALLVFALLTAFAIRVIGRHEYQLLKHRIGAYVEKRSKGAECRAAAYVASASMRQADSIETIWQTFGQAAEKMELDEAALTVFASNGDGLRAYRWSPNGGNGNGHGDGAHGAHGGGAAARTDEARWTAVFPLRTNGTPLGQLHVRKFTNGTPLAVEVPETLQLLTKALSINLDRVHAAHSSGLSATPR